MQDTNTYSLHNINNGDVSISVLGSSLSLLVGNKSPDLVEVDGGVVLRVLGQVVVTHTNLSEETGMVLIKVDSVVVHATSVTTSTGMLSVLPDTTMAGTDVPALLAVLAQPGRLLNY
tara:strand:+ start:545 stop:895 length:351 start_codon:yes stop_codon:yes gene_type:complete